MAHPDMGGDNWESELPPAPDGFAIPETAVALLRAIDGAKRKAASELEIARTEVAVGKEELFALLNALDTQFGTQGPDHTAYHTLPVDNGQQEVLITTRDEDRLGDCWHIIVNTKKYADGVVELDYSEYALTKAGLMFDYETGLAATTVPEEWLPEVLGQCAVLYKRTDGSYSLKRGAENSVVLPMPEEQPKDTDGLDDFTGELGLLADVLTKLSAGTHDESITNGYFF